MKQVKVTRALKLALFANPGRLKALRYSYERHQLFTRHFITQLRHKPFLGFLPTSEMDQLSNQVQHRTITLQGAPRVVEVLPGPEGQIGLLLLDPI